MKVVANNADSIPDFMVWGALLLVPVLIVLLLFAVFLSGRHLFRLASFNKGKRVDN